jgi:hypothetical protein
MHRNRDCSTPVPLRGASTQRNRFLILLQGHLTETDTAADIRCMIIRASRRFLNGDTNNPESIEAVEQIGWFQVLKGYIPKSGRQGKSASTDAGVKTRSTLQANSGQQHLLSSSGRMARSSERSVRSSACTRRNSPDNSSARVRQAAKQRVETAYARSC